MKTAEPDWWVKLTGWITTLGQQVGHKLHRVFITIILIVWIAVVIGSIVGIVDDANLAGTILEWRIPLIIIQAVVGLLMATALFFWLTKDEIRTLPFGVGAFLLSLVVLQMLYFYLSQFAAISSTLLQVGTLGILLSYRRWYMQEES